MDGTAPVVSAMQNLVGLIPLALLLGEVTEDLALRLGETIGGLLNATFGEARQMLSSNSGLVACSLVWLRSCCFWKPPRACRDPSLCNCSVIYFIRQAKP
jgi:hypothetical protein